MVQFLNGTAKDKRDKLSKNICFDADEFKNIRCDADERKNHVCIYKKLIWKSAVLMELSFLQYLAQEYTKIIHMSRL